MSPRPTLHALTGLRAIASVWVLLFHLLVPAKALFPALSHAGLVLENGFVGVDLFFVLSGFVLMHAYGDSVVPTHAGSLARFYWARLARIYPLHLATTVGLVVAAGLASALGFHTFANMDLFRTTALPSQLALVHGWGGAEPAWNVPSWSLSCEWLAYLAFPAVALILRQTRRRVTQLGIALLSLGAFVVFAEVWHAGVLDLTYDGGAVRLAGEFVAGCALGRLGIAKDLQIPKADVLAFALAALVLVVSATGPVTPLVVLPIAGFVACVAAARGGFARALSGRALRWLGARSFALYMVQGPVILVARGLFPESRLVGHSVSSRIAWIASVVLATVFAAAIAHTLVEAPAQRLMMKLGRPRRAELAVTSRSS